MQRIDKPYAEAHSLIEDGDVLLFRSRGGIWGLIAKMGRSEYTHVGVAGWWRGHVMLVEMTSKGGRAISLANVVDRWPGVVDVYRLNTRLSPMTLQNAQYTILSKMIEITSRVYGKWHLFKVSLYHAPFIRLFLEPHQLDTEKVEGEPFCSEAVSEAYLSADFDLVPNLANCFTEPADIGRSAILSYQFTLV